MYLLNLVLLCLQDFQYLHIWQNLAKSLQKMKAQVIILILKFAAFFLWSLQKASNVLSHASV